MDLVELLREMVERGGSDLILASGKPPLLRAGEVLVRLREERLSPEEAGRLVRALMTEEQQARLEAQRELDFALTVPGLGRFRFNAFYQRRTPAMVVRRVPSAPPDLEAIGLPKNVVGLLARPTGLLLVSGPTGSGKSTVLAAMVDWINRNYPLHIITIEDPIEYLHEDKVAAVSQREVGVDTRDFASALRAALRQSPDVIMIGEVRDAESAAVLLRAAQTGHLVLASVHGGSAQETVERLLEIFPEERRDGARSNLADVLLGVLNLRLVKRNGRPPLLAHEFLFATPAVRSLVREGKVHQVRHHMMSSEEMWVLEKNLAEMVRKGLLTAKEAEEVANHKGDFLWYLTGLKQG